MTKLSEMQRLIVEYSHGDDCTYTCEETIPVVYESAEKLLLDIENAVKAYLKYQDEKDAAWDKFHKKWQGKNDYTKDAYWAEHELITGKFPHMGECTVDIGGSTIYLDHFIYKQQIYLPEIYTVDEWFKDAESGEQ